MLKEVFRMWKYPSMIALTIITASIYIIGLVPFKDLPIIPGFTEIRPANMFPVVFGLLCGPAGAWGSAIGNLISDLFGTFSQASIFGFIGNFLLSLIPYKLWGRLGIYAEWSKTPTIDTPQKLIEFGIVTLISSSACALVIAWSADCLNLVPFATLSAIIVLNDTVMTLLLGPFILRFFYKRMKKLRLIWTDIMIPKDISEPKHPQFYSLLTAIGSIGGLVTGLAISFLSANHSIFPFSSNADSVGNIFIQIGVLPFLIMLAFGISKL